VNVFCKYNSSLKRNRVLTNFMGTESIVLAELTGVVEDLAGVGRRKNPKRTGELSEAGFLLKATSMGFRVAKPWGDSERYDFILDSGGRLWRVQLKCTEVVHARGYEVQPLYSVYDGMNGRSKAGYSGDDIDVLVVHIGPRDVWYVIPVEVLALVKNLRFYPDIACRCARLGELSGGLGVVGRVGDIIQFVILMSFG